MWRAWDVMSIGRHGHLCIERKAATSQEVAAFS
jgi:hypothetical protein